MTAIEKGIAAGELAAPKRRNHYRPVGYRHTGYLTAEIEDTRSGTIESIIVQAGELMHFELGRTASGDIRVFRPVGALKKIAKAMLNPNAEWRTELLEEVFKAQREQPADDTDSRGPRKARRKR